METLEVVGAGGIGCVVGYALAQAGVRVRFVEADDRKVREGRLHGVSVDGASVEAEFVSFADWQPALDATVILCTKCYDNAAVLERLPASTLLVPIQNGFDTRLEAWGHSHEGIASFVSECQPHAPCTRITRPGKLHLGSRGRQAGVDERWTRLVRLLSGAQLFRPEIVDDILPYKRTKLMYNAAIGPLAAMAGLDNGQLLSIPRARGLFFSLLRENYAILRGAGAGLGKIGPFHPDTVDRILRLPLLARTLAWAFYPSLRGSYCSMHADLPRGQTEIDNYNGFLIELAGARLCPVNRAVVAAFKRMEAERTPPALECLHALPV